jgi:hypothetical protein
MRARCSLVLALVLAAACATTSDGPPPPRFAGGASADQAAKTAAAPALAALRDGRFAEAAELARDERNPYARLVRALARYERTGHQLALDLRTLLAGLHEGTLNQRYLATTFATAEAELADVDADLAAAGADADLAIELCVACWELDWNGDGRIDDRDRRLFEIEQDADGKPIPEGDPRRRPTFRFDVGDVSWARAFVGFQRAVLDLALAYDFGEVSAFASERSPKLVVKLVHPDRVEQARKRALAAIDRSDEARRAYLAETDDDREWVPSPRQKSHPMPLPVDQKLYDTWEAVLGDLRRLLQGEEGIAIDAIPDLLGERHGHFVAGFVDVGGLLAHPRDLTVDLDELRRLERNSDDEGLLRAILGTGYAASMKASPLPGRLLRMRKEIDRREEPLERKLRYLFWIN